MIELKGGAQMDIPLMNGADDLYQQTLGNHPIGQFLSECGQSCGCPVTVRYECGDCCLKASNCRLAGIVNSFLGLKAFGPEGIITEPCECQGIDVATSSTESDRSGCSRPGCNVPIPVSGVQCALIPLDRVCCIESGLPQPPVVPQAAGEAGA